MKYAISRREDYDVERKLTWMVGSLLGASHDGHARRGADEARLVADLTRTIRGYRVKPKRLEALAIFPTSARPCLAFGPRRTPDRVGRRPRRLACRDAACSPRSCGSGRPRPCAPGAGRDVELVHRAMAGSLARTESALGLMADGWGPQRRTWAPRARLAPCNPGRRRRCRAQGVGG